MEYVNNKTGGVDGLMLNRRTISNVNGTALSTDYLIAYISLTANRTLTLPNSLCSPSGARALMIVNETNSAFSVIVQPESGTISGYSSFALPANGAIPVYCNGSNWFIY